MNDPFDDFISELFSNTTSSCVRCGVDIRVAEPPKPDARLLRYATAGEVAKSGACVNCTATKFLKETQPLGQILKEKGTDMLLNPMVQNRFGQMMIVGKADAKPDEIDWSSVVKNWSLP